ncbi:MAG: DHH family phosphoesterase [Peptococcaceae bacterium]|jgi:phosphoglycolate phosphatase|nr:DHH family phosphoesterase [Peptococcaceae bacterium]
MDINQFAAYKNIVIQCHDIPDADTIGAGFALRRFLLSRGADAALVYGGRAEITKPNLVMLLQALDIDIRHVQALPPETDLLITVDCQRGAGNTQNFDLPDSAAIFVIDHHRAEIPEGKHTLIRPELGSCATLMWILLEAAGFAVSEDHPARDALYYGLFTDTGGLAETRHPLDRDLADIPHDGALIRKLSNSAITLTELSTIGEALKEREIIDNIGLFRAEPCDPNLLGFASDIAKQVAGIDCCVVYCGVGAGLKLSIRSCAREIMADEFAAFLCRDAGAGGGNIEKAGGFMGLAKIAGRTEGKISPEEYLAGRVRDYLANYDHIYAEGHDVSFAELPLYRKLPRPVGFVRSVDIFPAGAKITIRTLEGDVDAVSGEDIYLMIGILGEVYPILREKFANGYDIMAAPYSEPLEYVPAAIDRGTGERRLLLRDARACMPRGEKLVRAKRLDKDTKVFTYWDPERYFHGERGDYLVAGDGDFNDCYIVRQDIFHKSYERLVSAKTC